MTNREKDLRYFDEEVPAGEFRAVRHIEEGLTRAIHWTGLVLGDAVL